MSFVFADFLHYAQKVDAREEISPRKLGYWFGRQLRCRVAHFVNVRWRAPTFELPLLKGQCRKFIFALWYS